MKGTVRSSGQVVLITLLVLTIATTVALSLIARTTTDTTITSQVVESSRAFSAAEAGVEEALKSASNSANELTAGVSYTVTVSPINSSTGVFEFPTKVERGSTGTVWLVNHDANNVPIEDPNDPGRYNAPSIDICWNTDATTIPALAVTLLYKKSDGTYQVAHTAFDPSSDRAQTDNFSTVVASGGCGGNTGTDYRATLTFNDLGINRLTDTLMELRIRPVYNDATIAVDAGTNQLPLQGHRIESTGTTTTGMNRKIVVYQQYRSPSTIFDAALYSQGSLTQ
ncbi:MAG TPA: hypothetical protein VMR81_00250 [Patescibacteria group bacterium]|nr:hypothetical protein [Patescibacteria group bacterium]